MRCRFLLVLAALPTLSCATSITVPVAVVSKDVPGGIMQGTNTASLSGGSFEVSNGSLTCGGTYRLGNPSPTIAIPVLCNDGRKGLVTATRDYGGMSGGGHFTLHDGTTGDFAFGEAACRLLTDNRSAVCGGCASTDPVAGVSPVISQPPEPLPRPTASPVSPPTAPHVNASETASAKGQNRVKMENNGGTYEVPVSINGQFTLKFVVDSGASDVQIPSDVVSTLKRTGTISEGDFIGTRTYVLADGSKVPSERFTIRSLKVGDVMLENVDASVAPEAGSLLLGQSFLGRFDSWSIDNARHALVLTRPN